MRRLVSFFKPSVPVKTRKVLSNQRLLRLCQTPQCPFKEADHQAQATLPSGIRFLPSFRRGIYATTSQIRRLSTQNPEPTRDKDGATSHHLCQRCSQLDFAKIFQGGIGSSLAAHEEPEDVLEEVDDEENVIQLGPLGEIAKRPDCPFCRLVIHMVRATYPDIEHFEDVDIRSETEGRVTTVPFSRVTCGLSTIPADKLDDFRRQPDAGPSATHLGLVLRFNGGRIPSSRCLILDAADTAPRRLPRYPDVSPRPCFYSGRSINPEQVDFNTLRDWLDACENSHSYPRCRHKSITNPSTVPEFRVIDVHCRTVVSAPPACRYAALSYVWGPPSFAKNMFRLKHGSSAHKEDLPIGLPSLLPRTIEDAMIVARELGERYIWIDALCIYDDDAQDKKTQISGMADIYRNALFTVVAAHGDDADAGLAGVRPGSRIGEPQYSEVIDGLRIYVSLPSLGRELSGNAEMPDEQAVNPPPAEDFPGYVEEPTSSGWISRAWTMQEGLLSARCLVFTASQAFWVCSAELCCESIAEPPKSQRFWLKPPKWWSTFSSPLVLTPSETLEEPFEDLYMRSTYEFDTYSELVRDYSKRQLTFQHDKLNAIDGILRAMSYRLGPVLFWGLPEASFDLALLWRASSCYPELLRNTDVFPTWSWASWPGEIRYAREIRLPIVSQNLHAKPMNEYFKETSDKRREPILQLSDDDTETSDTRLSLSCTSQTFSPLLYFEASSARFRIFSVMGGGSWFRIGTDPPCHLDPQPDVGLDIWIDNPMDQKRLDGKVCNFIVLSEWKDESAIDYHIWDAYRSPVYNVMCIEWKHGVAYRLGVGSIKTEIWDKARPVKQAIKLG